MARKSISVYESSVNEATSKVLKKCVLIEKMLKELNTKARKIETVKNDADFGDNVEDKFGQLDDISVALEQVINLISKL